MKFVTLVPFTFWIIVLFLLGGAWFLGLPGFVVAAIVLLMVI